MVLLPFLCISQRINYQFEFLLWGKYWSYLVFRVQKWVSVRLNPCNDRRLSVCLWVLKTFNRYFLRSKKKKKQMRPKCSLFRFHINLNCWLEQGRRWEKTSQLKVNQNRNSRNNKLNHAFEIHGNRTKIVI